MGRFVVLGGTDGRTHAVSAQAVATVSETDGGSAVLLPGGRTLFVPRPMGTVLGWSDGRGAAWRAQRR